MDNKSSNKQWQHKQQSTDNRQKSKIEKPEQLQWNELKSNKQQHQKQQTIKLIISIDKSKDNLKQINR